MVFQSNGIIWGIKWATYGRDGQAQFDHALVTVPEKNQIRNYYSLAISKAVAVPGQQIITYKFIQAQSGRQTDSLTCQLFVTL